MNEKQVKKWAAVSLVICFVLLMVPTIWSSVGEVTVYGTATAGVRMGGIVVASLVLILLIFMIYSDDIISYFDRRKG